MALIDDIFPLRMADMERGATVLRNLSYLSADLNDSAEVWSIKDGSGADVFGVETVCVVDQEDVEVGAANAIARGENSTTPAAHKNGTMVRVKGGTLIATFAFTGLETITGIWAAGNGPAMYQIKCGADFGPMKFSGGLGQEVFLPFSGITPQDAEVITVYAWTNLASVNCWAYTTR